MSKIKVAVIGCGTIANSAHIPAYMNNPEVEIKYFCDIIPEKAQAAVEKYGCGTAIVDYREILDDPEIEAVSVCTPNRMHTTIAIDFLEHGKHVLCEKPAARTYAEAKLMQEAQHKSGKVLTIGYQNRWRPDSLYLKDLCDEGEFGEIYYAEATALRRRAVPTWGVFIDEEKQGGGPLIDIGTHALDLTLHMMNNYEPAFCVGKTFHKLNKQTGTGNSWGDWDTEKFTAEDSAFGFIVMKNGAVINLRSSWALNYVDCKEAVTLICGDKGGADMPASGELRINGIKNSRQYVMTPNLKRGGVAFFEGKNGGNPNDLEAACFLGAIRGKCNLNVTAEEAACVTKILEGIYISEKTGKPYYFD